MAGAIKTSPVTKEYEEGWDRLFGGGPGHDSLVEEVAGMLTSDIEAHTKWHEEHPGEEHVTAADLSVPEAADWTWPLDENRLAKVLTAEAPGYCPRCHRTDLSPGAECACNARMASVNTSLCRGCGAATDNTDGRCSDCQRHVGWKARARAEGSLRG